MTPFLVSCIKLYALTTCPKSRCMMTTDRGSGPTPSLSMRWQDIADPGKGYSYMTCWISAKYGRESCATDSVHRPSQRCSAHDLEPATRRWLCDDSVTHYESHRMPAAGDSSIMPGSPTPEESANAESPARLRPPGPKKAVGQGQPLSLGSAPAGLSTFSGSSAATTSRGQTPPPSESPSNRSPTRPRPRRSSAVQRYAAAKRLTDMTVQAMIVHALMAGCHVESVVKGFAD